MELVGKPFFKDGHRTQMVKAPQGLRYQAMLKVFNGVQSSMEGLRELAHAAADDTTLTVPQRRLIIGSSKALVTNLGDFVRRIEKDNDFMDWMGRATSGRVHRQDQP